MAANKAYVSAGLPVARDSGQSPTSGVNTPYLSAGLQPEPQTEPPIKVTGSRVRPHNFTLDPAHPLSQGLVFAGMGAFSGTGKYVDSSPYGNHGELFFMDPATDWITGAGRAGVSTDGADDLVIFDAVTARIGSAFTVSCRVRASAAELAKSDSTMLSLAAPGIASYNTLEIRSGSASYVQRNTTWTNSPAGALSADKWHHVCGVTSNTELTVYLDGTPGTSASGDAPANFTYATAGALRRDSGGNLAFFNGEVLDIIVYNRALSPAEIAILADPDPMLDGWVQPTPRKSWPSTFTTAPTPTTYGKIFKSRIIRGAA